MSNVSISVPTYKMFMPFNEKVNLKLSDFCKTIRSNISSEDLELFNKNISNLKINSSYFLKEKIFHNNFVVGEYLPFQNMIKINKYRFKGTIDHELLHVASTYCTEDDKVYSGFSLQSLDNSIGSSSGVALTEGYTEILRKRYFKKDADNENSYDLEICFALLIEFILGREKMEKYYFNADVEGFILGLSEYNNLNDVENFLKAVDDFTFCKNYQQANDALKFTYRFIIDCYLNKEFKNNEDYNDKNKLLQFFLFYKMLPQEFDFKGKIYKIDVQDIVNNEIMISKSKNKRLSL